MAVNYSVEKNYLYIKADGVWDMSTAKTAQENAMTKLQEEGLSLLLLDISEVDNRFTLHEILQVNSRVQEVFPSHIKHAIVFSKESMDFSTAKFSEDVSINRGINIRMFNTKESAEEWLSNINKASNG